MEQREGFLSGYKTQVSLLKRSLYGLKSYNVGNLNIIKINP